MTPVAAVVYGPPETALYVRAAARSLSVAAGLAGASGGFSSAEISLSLRVRLRIRNSSIRRAKYGSANCEIVAHFRPHAERRFGFTFTPFALAAARGRQSMSRQRGFAFISMLVSAAAAVSMISPVSTVQAVALEHKLPRSPCPKMGLANRREMIGRGGPACRMRFSEPAVGAKVFARRKVTHQATT